MGGHGALITALKTGDFKSASAFAPISNPTVSPNWGSKGYEFFFSNPKEEGIDYDATELVKSGKGKKVPLLIEVGSQDQWKKEMLT